VDTDSDVELAVRPAPHPWLVLREHAHLVPVISVGGAVGALSRWGLAQAMPHASDAWAWATLWTNVGGAFLLGLLMSCVLTIWAHTRFLRPLLGVGVLGGFTTFSTAELDTRGLLAVGHAGEALAYAGTSVALGLVAIVVGLGLGNALLRRMAR